MDWFVRRFIKAALVWLGLGVTMGVAMAVHPMWIIYRPAHVHMNLLGFVTMMIYGVAYYVVPRFFGHSLYSKRLAGAHWWLSNIGLGVMVVGFIMAPHFGQRSVPILGAGGTLSALGAFAFIFNVWRTIDGPAALQRVAQVPASRRPPLVQKDS
jgi:cbb3-type cytochrome oxidase subunit 1